MAIDMMSMFDSQNNIEYLVSQYVALEAGPRNQLVYQRNELDGRRTALSDLDSKLSAMMSKLDRLTDPITDYFASKLATGSDSEKFTVNASSAAALGNHSLSVARLASSDTRVSNRYDDDLTTISDLFTGDQSFVLNLAHPEDDLPDQRVDITIDVAASTFEGQSNEDVLRDIADAINTTLSTAVTNEELSSDEVVRASVITEVNGES